MARHNLRNSGPLRNIRRGRTARGEIQCTLSLYGEWNNCTNHDNNYNNVIKTITYLLAATFSQILTRSRQGTKTAKPPPQTYKFEQVQLSTIYFCPYLTLATTKLAIVQQLPTSLPSSYRDGGSRRKVQSFWFVFVSSEPRAPRSSSRDAIMNQ